MNCLYTKKSTFKKSRNSKGWVRKGNLGFPTSLLPQKKELIYMH